MHGERGLVLEALEMELEMLVSLHNVLLAVSLCTFELYVVLFFFDSREHIFEKGKALYEELIPPRVCMVLLGEGCRFKEGSYGKVT